MRLPFRGGKATGAGVQYQVVEVIGQSAQDLDDAIERAAERLAERRKTPSAPLPRPDVLGLLLAVGGAAAAFGVVRTLLQRDPASLGLPEPLVGPATGAANELSGAREAMREGIALGRIEAANARRELLAEYHARVGRTAAGGATSEPPGQA